MSKAWGFTQRAVRRAAPALALVVVFLVTSVLGLVIHLDTTPGRRLVAREANVIVSKLLISDLRIERIDVLSSTRLFVSRVTLVDRLGKPVLVAEKLDVRFGLIALLSGILGSDDVRVTIDDVRAERVALWLTRDTQRGGFTLETAFDPVPSPTPSTTPSRVFVALPRIVVAEVSVATDQPGIEKTAARVRGLSAGLDVSPAGLVFTLKSDDTKVSKLLPRDIQGRLRSSLRFPGTTEAELDARVGEVPATASVSLRGSELELGFRSNELGPAGMRDLVAGWPLVAPLALRANAKGEPGAMKVRTEGQLSGCRFSGTGSLALSPALAGNLAMHLEDLDLRSFDAAAPETALDVDATVSVRFADELEVEASATLAESTVSGTPVPPLKVTGKYARGRFAGTATVLDPKLATDADFEISPDGKIEFTTRSTNVELEALARYGVNAKGRATLRSRGAFERGRLDVAFDGSSRSPSTGVVRADNVVLRGRVHGPVSKLDELEVDVEVEGERLDLGDLELDHFRATSKGSVARQTVTFEGSSKKDAAIDVSAELALGDGVVLRDVRLESQRGSDSVRVTAKRVAVERGGVTLSELSLRAGEGTVSGSIAARGGRTVVDLTLTDLDLGSALSAVGLSPSGLAGRIDGRVRFDEVNGQRSGDATLALRDGAFPPFEGISAELEAEFEGSEIRTDAKMAVAGLAKGELHAKGSLRRSVFDPRALRELTGQGTLGFVDLDLDRASRPWLGGTGVELRGNAKGSVSLTRTEPSGLPAVSYAVSTHAFTIVRQAEGGGRPSEMHLDIGSVGELLRADGSHVGLELVDAEGPWIVAKVNHALSAEAFERAGQDWKRAILGAPIRANVRAHRRPLRMFGNAGASALDGTISGAVEVTGNALEPELDAKASLANFDEGASGQLDLALKYSATGERYTLSGRTTGDRDHLEVTSTGRFGWLGRGLGRDWSAKGEATVTHFGLDRLGRLVGVPVEGEASGRCSFDIEAENVNVKAEVAIDRLLVERRPIGSGKGSATIGKGRAEAKFAIEEGSSKLELDGDAGLVWSDHGPELDPRRGGSVGLTARDFDLAALRPFVRSAATRVSGKLHGHAELGWGPLGSSPRRPTTLRANATVTDATASLTAGGGLIQKVHVQALAEGGPLRITFSGAARSREPNIKGTATLLLEGPRLRRLDAKFNVNAFPLLYDGILMGRATTHPRWPLEFSIVAKDAGQTIDVHIPAVEVTLPKSTDKSLIELKDDRSIEIADAPIDADERRRAASGPSSTTLKVRLGKQVRIKRGALEVPVTGAITVLPSGRLSGSIVLPQGGVVPALGQLFRIRRGVIQFKEQDVNDGTLAIQAWTRAADGTVIDLDVSGTVREPVIAFNSDPPRSEDEIIALLLGIQADTSTSAENGESEQLGNAAKALAMNRLLEGSALSGLQFGSGETEAGDSVSTVTMRVASKVWFEGRTVKGSQYSVNPDERVSGVVDWRFAPSWSLRTQLGDVSGVELRWSLRY